LRNNRIPQYFPYLFFAVIYIYVWMWIKPCLYFQRSASTFIFDHNYIHQFFNFPGGLTELTGSFLSQFYYHSWLGAGVIVGTLILIFIIMRRILCHVYKHTVDLSYIPVILLLSLHTEYDHAITTDIGILLSLIFFYMYVRAYREQIKTNAFVFLLLTLLLYYLAAGWIFLFILLAVIYDLLFTGKIVPVFIYVTAAVIVPYFAYAHVCIMSLTKSYFFLLPFSINYYSNWYPHAALLIFPLILVVSGFMHRLPEGHKAVRFFKSAIATYPMYIISGVLLITLLFLSAQNKGRIVLLFDYYAAEHQWERVIELAANHNPEHVVQMVQINRSLYHRHELLNKMFAYRQDWRAEGLIPSLEFCYAYPMLRSDLFFEMGHLNESQHWALEELSPYGDTPRNIVRLAQITILKQNEAAAHSFISLLEKTLFYSKQSGYYRTLITDKNRIASDLYLHAVTNMIPADDFLINANDPFADLEELVLTNNKNRMVFEYLMASFLLSFRLNKMIKYLPLLNYFPYPELPAHIEEGILAYMYLSGDRNIDLGRFHIKPLTLQRFRQFVTVLNRHKDNIEAARNELQHSFSDTYWYYSTFKNPLINQSE
jgi:hypothetical protein